MAELKRPEGVCKDCWMRVLPSLDDVLPARSWWRAAPWPGPRCTTDHRAEQRRRKAATQVNRDAKVYGLAEGGYDELMRIQEGHCSICLRATGASRRLSVDHSHATGEIRGLLCRPCNTMLGHGRDDPNFFERAVNYLLFPPANDMDPRFLLPKDDADA